MEILLSIFLTISYLSSHDFAGAAVDKNYQNCNTTQTCGNQSISFPFHIQGVQEPYCGHPSFQLSCDNDVTGPPVLNLSGDSYEVHQIFYQNRSLIVSNAALFTQKAGPCISPLKNLSLPAGSDLSLGSDQRQVYLLYNCVSYSWYTEEFSGNGVKSNCSNNGYSVLALSDDYENKMADAADKCGTGGPVAAPVLEYGPSIDLTDALSRGFRLNWNPTLSTNCKKCNATGGICGSDQVSSTFTCYCPNGPSEDGRCDHAPGPSSNRGSEPSSSPPARGKSKSSAYKAVAAIGIIAFVGVLVVVILYCLTKMKRNKTYQEVQSKLRKHGALQVTVYCYSDIKKMTRSFADKLGQGGFGDVYKGELNDGRLVAVKVLKQSKGEHVLGKEKPRGVDDELDQFINEVATISTTSHVNIVTLLGFCFEPSFWFEGTRRALVFEYMSEGSLDKFLFDQSKMGKLNWEKRYQISIGIARGLEYLHRGCNKRIVHFDIKPGNILLDKDFVPKISDFGLAKTCPEKVSLVSMSGLRGTRGYIAPEIYYNRNFQGASHKSDVYSYGMMILDIVGVRNNTDNTADNTSEAYFPDCIYKHLEVDEEMQMTERIIYEEDRVQKRKMIIVSLWCIQDNPSSRPIMSEVIKMLETNLESLQAPPKRYLSFPSRITPTDSSSTLGSV